MSYGKTWCIQEGGWMNFGTTSFDSPQEVEDYCESIESETFHDYEIMDKAHVYFYSGGDEFKIILAQGKEIVYLELNSFEADLLVNNYHQFRSELVHLEMINKGVI